MLEYAENVQDTDTLHINGIDYVHPEYTQYLPRWQKARDVIEGEEEIKKTDKREEYLPRLSGHSNTPEGNLDYNSYVEYAELYNATGRTVDAYRGLLNRKLPNIVVPEQVKDLVNSFTIKGESIYTFIEQVEVEVITTNRVGIFVDYPYVGNGIKLSKSEAKRLNMQPYATMYTAESIINWEETRINNRVVTSLVVLKEESYVRTTSYIPEKSITYRILELDENQQYRQIVVKPEYIEVGSGLQKKQKLFNVVKDIVYPKQNGRVMNYIPFYPVTAKGITWDLSKSIIHDIVNVNISHYRNTAEYEKALAWTASPTAVFSGLPDDQQSVAIGSSQGIIIAPGGTAKYLEYEGKGLEDLKQALDKKEEQMAVLGAKILATEHNGVESGEAARIHRAGEQGVLADIATTVGGAIEKAIRVICDWRSILFVDSDVLVDITKDYTPAIIDANTIIALGQEVNAGRLSYESYIGALQKGEIIPPTRSAEDEMNLINKTHSPAVMSSKTQLKYIDKKQADDLFPPMEEEEENNEKESEEIPEDTE